MNAVDVLFMATMVALVLFFAGDAVAEWRDGRENPAR